MRKGGQYFFDWVISACFARLRPRRLLRPSEEDFAKLEAIFNRLDVDKSGLLNTAELVKVALSSAPAFADN